MCTKNHYTLQLHAVDMLLEGKHVHSIISSILTKQQIIPPQFSGTMCISVKIHCDHVSSAEPYLHRRVPWRSAGAETDEQQDSPLLVRPFKSNLSLVRSNIWLLDCAVHCLYCPALALNATSGNFQPASTCFAGFDSQKKKKKCTCAGKAQIAGAPPLDPPLG